MSLSVVDFRRMIRAFEAEGYLITGGCLNEDGPHVTARKLKDGEAIEDDDDAAGSSLRKAETAFAARARQATGHK